MLNGKVDPISSFEPTDCIREGAVDLGRDPAVGQVNPGTIRKTAERMSGTNVP